jgi:hypothetical protein
MALTAASSVTEAATANRLAALGDDLGGHAVGGLLGQVVDDHLGALAGQVQRMGAAQAPAGARDDRDASLKQHQSNSANLVPH